MVSILKAIRSHHLFPNRKIAVAILTWVVATVVALLTLDPSSPAVVAVYGFIPIAAAYMVTGGPLVKHFDNDEPHATEEKALAVKPEPGSASKSTSKKGGTSPAGKKRPTKAPPKPKK